MLHVMNGSERWEHLLLSIARARAANASPHGPLDVECLSRDTSKS